MRELVEEAVILEPGKLSWVLAIEVTEPTPLLNFPFVMGVETDRTFVEPPGGPDRKNSASSEVVLLGDAMGSLAFNLGTPLRLLGRTGSDLLFVMTGAGLVIFLLGGRSLLTCDVARIVPLVSGRSADCRARLRGSFSGPVVRIKSAKSLTESCWLNAGRATGPLFTDPADLTDGVGYARELGGVANSKSLDSRLVGLDLKPFKPLSDFAEREDDNAFSGGGPLVVATGDDLLA